jgi:polyhydroxybutyrate depolymerase
MAARLGCDLADRVAAIAPVAGGYRTLPACRPARPVSVLEIHGTDDRTVPYNGRSPDDEGRVDRYVWGWALRDGCGRTPRRSRLSPRVHRVDWGACAAGSTVVHLRLDGGEHAWPGSTPPGAGPRLPISATRETWRFFSAHPAA